MDRFTDNGDNTITDTQTGLTWTKNTIASDVTHEQAEKAVADLGGEWRLPTIQELFTLVDHSRHLPAINTEVFPDTESDWYWSSTEASFSASARWVVYFGYGDVGGFPRTHDACVRAVRAGQ
ncbi:DUF1566 domain-containing protein [Marinobacter sp. M1N3S26]|uniref:Lcl C-terminal domain-containing protein n=1 Tax=Marinobacter sp. M1N3S26 TaxID=3382299 RepID=UPI00387B20A0